ncbi:MFS transporter [Nocardia aurantia]|uniref:Putative metabolite transport protein CsbC n=1 Tax=Nocardia aurantia TaxID=2585199 RepID=A0A7K0DWF5_9NOCA|nr:MFS transporter [Nocardia aurantia]MQY30113.1 putative metabolite transport protein CsbC [Nocardia aurantia]
MAVSDDRTSDRQRLRWGTIAAFSCFLYGYCSGVVAGAQLYFGREFRLGTGAQGAVVAIFLLGAAAGALIAGRCADRFGRKPTLFAAGVLFGLGLVLAQFAPNVGVLLLSRVAQGVAAGLASAVVPSYLSEIADDAHRGRLGSINQLMVTLGLLVSYLVNLAFAASGDWRRMFGAGLIAVVLFLIALPTVAESPAWLRRRGEGAPQPPLRALFRSPVRRAVVLGTGLCVLQQFCGINAVLYFAPTIIEQTGLAATDSILYSVYIGALNVVMTEVSITLIDRAGRRPLLLISTVAMTIALIPLGASFRWDLPGGSVTALICLLAFVAAFAIGTGPVVWLLVSELLPPPMRARGTGLCTTVNWLANFTVSQSFLPLIHGIGQGRTFWLFAVVCLLGTGFVAHWVPETKGRTDAEIAVALAT